MDQFLGQITMFGFSFAPRGWALCNGQLLPIDQYTALFSLLGVQYGGDGRTTFGLPNLQSRVPMHQGTGQGLSNRQMGQLGGVEQVTLSVNQMPSHNHATAVTSSASIMAESRAGTSPDPAGNILAAGTNIFRPNAPTEDVAMDSAMINMNVDVVTQANGGNVSHENMPPFQVVSFCICLQGVYPSRN